MKAQKMTKKFRNLLPKFMASGAVILNVLDIATAKTQIAALNDAEHFYKRIVNKSSGKLLRVSNVGAEKLAHIYIDDELSKYYGVSASDIVQAFADIGDKDVILHINCAGGDVMQARQICATIAAHKGVVTAQIEGLCASAATFITCACDKVEMNEGSLFMIHNASAFCWGDYKAMNKQSEILLTITDSIADDYVAKTGSDKQEILKLMDAETFFTADAALDAGFIDSIIKPIKEDGEAKNNCLPLDGLPEPEPEAIISNTNHLHAQALVMCLELSENA